MTAGDDRLVFDVDVTPEDFAQFLRHMTRSQAQLARTYRVLGALVGAMLGIAIAIGPTWFRMTSLSLVLVVAFMLRAGRRARFALFQPLLSGQFVVDSRGLALHRTGFMEYHDWTAIECITVGESHIFLRVTAASGLVIPYRCFSEQGDRERFVSLATAARAGTSDHHTS